MLDGSKLLTVVLACVLAQAACRQGDPQDPRTPANSPLPDIDRPKDATPRGDAGFSGGSGTERASSAKSAGLLPR